MERTGCQPALPTPCLGAILVRAPQEHEELLFQLAGLALVCHHPQLPPQRMMHFQAPAEQGPKGGEGFLQSSVKGGYLSKNWLHLMG